MIPKGKKIKSILLAYEKHVTPGEGHFWPQGDNLNKLGRSPLGDATYKYHGFRTYGFRQEYLNVFPYISLCKTCDSGAGPFLDQGP